MQQRTRSRAFSLIELLVVISIIGILTAIAIVSFTASRMRTRDTTRKTQVLNIQSALEQYRSQNSVYAPAFVYAGLCNDPTPNLDTSGLGPCFYNVGLDSTPSTDPMFNTGATNSGYLLPLVAKPTIIPATGIGDAGAGFPLGEDGASATAVHFNLGTINYRVQSTYYVVRVILENKSTSCLNVNPPAGPIPGQTGGVSGYLLAFYTLGSYKFKDAVYPIPYLTCDGNYKIFQKSSTPNF